MESRESDSMTSEEGSSLKYKNTGRKQTISTVLSTLSLLAAVGISFTSLFLSLMTLNNHRLFDKGSEGVENGGGSGCLPCFSEQQLNGASTTECCIKDFDELKSLIEEVIEMNTQIKDEN